MEYSLLSPKPFDKIWHDGLTFKPRQNSISGEITNILQDLLRDTKQSCLKWSVFILG